jgi:hypothetical protein
MAWVAAGNLIREGTMEMAPAAALAVGPADVGHQDRAS